MMPSTRKRDRATFSDATETSFLVAESPEMMKELREKIQDSIRRLGKVNALKNREIMESLPANLQEEVANLFEKHPYLDKQPLDGIDPSLFIDEEAFRNWKKARNEQNEKKQQKALELQLEKQLELGITPTYTPKFNPKPGR